VHEVFIKPAVRQEQYRFAEILALRFPSLCSQRRSTHYLSYWGGHPFVDMLSAFEAHAESESMQLWISCFAVDEDSERPETIESSELYSGVFAADVEHALLLDRDLSALRRLWVLWEMRQSQAYGSPLRLLLPADSTDMSVAAAKLAESSVCWMNAACSKSADGAYIREAVYHSGVRAASHQVELALFVAMETELLRSADASGGEALQRRLIRADSHDKMGDVFAKAGRAADARREFARALAIRLVRLEEAHSDTAASRTKVSQVLLA